MLHDGNGDNYREQKEAGVFGMGKTKVQQINSIARWEKHVVV